MPGELDATLVETVARHFPAARIEDDKVWLGVGDLAIDCHVDQVLPLAPQRYQASLFFQISGGGLTYPVFASISGYDAEPQAAIVEGGCVWCCTFGPVLRAGLGGEHDPGATELLVEVDGRRWRAHVAAFDRAFGAREDELDRRTRAARDRFGRPFVLGRVLASQTLPALTGDGPVVIGVFIGDRPGGRTVETKVNGGDWPPASASFDDVPGEPDGGFTFLRELAVLTPLSKAPPLRRASLVCTGRGFRELHERHDASWTGWLAHRGELAPPLTDKELARVEAVTGMLPDDYRRFLREVAAGGYGPGHGLIAPLTALQRRAIAGEMSWTDGAAGDAAPAGVLALAHAGCDVWWVLVLRGPHRGEVWVDPAGSDGITRRVAGSFDAWYRAWLATELAGRSPWVQWDATACSPASVIAQALEATDVVEPGCLAGKVDGLAIASSTRWRAEPTPIPPCERCGQVAVHYGIPLAMLGTEPPQSREPRFLVDRLRGWFR